MFFALTALLLAVVSVRGDHNEVTLGSAMHFSVPKDTSTCALKLTVPASVVKPGCKLRIRYDIATADPRQPTLSFFLKKGGNGDFTDADKKATVNGEYDSDCEAGDFSFGTKVESCALCILGAEAKFYISWAIIQDGNAIVDFGQASSFYTGTFYMPADKYIVHKFKTTAANQIAHFKIIKSFTSAFDSLNYYAAPGSATIADATVDANKLSSSAALDGGRRIQVNATTVGDYQFIIKLGSIGNKTELATQFQLNTQPDDVTYHEARCPQVSCSAADYQGCSVCSKNGCNWCGGDENACQSAFCKTEANMIHDDKTCPDIDAECRKFEKDCVKCLSAKKGCIYCDTGATFGISSGQCSAGVDGLGKACNAVGDAIKLTKKYTEASACPASASTIVASLAAVVVAVASMF